MKAMVNGLLAVALCLGAASAAAAKKGKAIKTWTPDELKWVDVPKSNGVKMAVAWGNPKRGAHGAFHKFPGGWEAPLHFHSNTIKAGILTGTVVWTPEGGTGKDLPAGSFAVLPGRSRHTTACKAGADCIIFSVVAGRFDLRPVKVKGKPKAAEKKPEEKAEEKKE